MFLWLIKKTLFERIERCDISTEWVYIPLDEMLLGALGERKHELASKVPGVMEIVMHHFIGPVLRRDVAFEDTRGYGRLNSWHA